MSVVEAGISVVAADAPACPLCASRGAKPAPARVDRYELVLPWAAAMTGAVIAASVGIATGSLFGSGAVAGLLAGAGLAALTVRRTSAASEIAHHRAIEDLNEEADTRVSMVIRQFEWAINDLARVKREHDRARVTADLLLVQGRGRERHIKKLERDLAQARDRVERLAAFAHAVQQGHALAEAERTDDTVPFRWGMHVDGDTSRLELECDIRYRATRVRVIDRAGIPKIRSATAMHSGDGALCFALAHPPAELLADLDAGREPAYRIQAHADGAWQPVRLLDTGRRTRVMTDKQGRAYRVNDVTIDDRRALAWNPFDLTSDGTFFSL